MTLIYGFDVKMCMVFVFLIAPSCTAGYVVILQFSFPFEYCIMHAYLSKRIISNQIFEESYGSYMIIILIFTSLGKLIIAPFKI